MQFRFRSDRRSAFLAAGVLVATAAVGSVAEAAQPRKGCVRVEVSSEVGGPKARRFFASKIEDLHFRVVFRKKKVFEPNETLDLAIYLPEGHLYKRLTIPVSDSGLELERPVAGHPFAVHVRRAGWDARLERPVVTAPPFPVAGTHITQHSLYGQWVIEAWPQGSERPCVGKFRLKP
jgi:hypothetical protein